MTDLLKANFKPEAEVKADETKPDEREEYEFELKACGWIILALAAFNLAMTILWWNKP